MEKKRVVKETLPLLFLLVLGGALAGSVLANMESVLRKIPGLIVIVPAVIGMRGNISTTLSSRLGSAYHLGMLERGLTSEVGKENIKASLALSLFTSALFPVLLYPLSFFLPFEVSSRVIVTIFLVSITTGMSSAIILIILTFSIVSTSLKFGLDPDNISGPVLTTVGDVFTLLIMFGYANLFWWLIL
ncbi:MAG: magnesium transporter [Candidatus Thermoplasmatota archaeon]|nr:magnesium transporter [Candidatus Thermoplasmatota archaeon]MBS3789589.1 magnesium transporter [Candidatus Thermoplasmatota archaeon]